MAGITIQFTPWPPFHAREDLSAVHQWLDEIGRKAEQIFKGGMGHYPPASSPGAWPNNRTGVLNASISHEVTGMEMVIGSNTHYAGFLRSGTSKMARRKMSDNALQEAMGSAPSIGHWVQWARG